MFDAALQMVRNYFYKQAVSYRNWDPTQDTKYSYPTESVNMFIFGRNPCGIGYVQI